MRPLPRLRIRAGALVEFLAEEVDRRFQENEAATEALQQSEKELPNDYNPPARLALVYREMGRLDDALAAVDRALTKVYGPRKLRVLETKASIFAKKGDAAAQKQTLTAAVAHAKALPVGQRNEKTIARLEGALQEVASAAKESPK